MSTPPISQTTQTNKCPHGFPVGACPICSGMAGGTSAKNRDKPRKPGEMTYNECMAQWIQMQRAKEAKDKQIQNKQDFQLEKLKEELKLYTNAIKSFEKAMVQIKAMAGETLKNISNIINKLPVPLKTALKPVIALVNFTISVILTSAKTITTFVNSTVEKLSSLLGETKNFIKSLFENNFREKLKALKTVLSLFLDHKDNKKENEKAVEEKISKFKKIKKFIKTIKKGKKEKDDELL